MMDDDDHHANGKNKPPSPRRRRCRYCCSGTLLMILLTNAISITIVSSGSGSSSAAFLRRYYTKPAATLVRLWDTSAALRTDLNATNSALAAGQADLAGLHARLRTANELLRTLLLSMHDHNDLPSPPTTGWGWKRELGGELKLALAAGDGTALGHACVTVQDELERYMNYVPGGECPSSDEVLAHKLLLAGCVPLPRRRCRPPRSSSRAAAAAAITGGERWERDDGKLSYSIEAVLRTRPNGTVRIGVDLAGDGGSPAAAGTFAARMMERAGATVLTVGVAARGRLPLLDGTMDIVHAGSDLAGGGGGEMMMLEFALYDVYRVLRPGGLVWLDHFVCDAAGGGAKQVNKTLVPLMDRVGFRKLRWNTGKGKEKKEQWYVSALLEKPMA